MLRHTLILLPVVIALASPSPAQERQQRRQSGGRDGGPPPTTAPADPKEREKAAEDKLSVTEHETRVNGQPLKYRATAGTMAMKDEAGKHKASMFFVAYERLPRAENAVDRPITYVFNGGPGAAAVWLHLGTAGPKRVDLTETGEVPPPPYQVVDNEHTWLDSTDLVFIDPVGTGFSREAPGEDPRQFYGVEQDLRAVGDFIRLYTTRNGRWASPKFLAGESYGTTRAAALSEYLLDNLGISLNGVVLISSVLDFQTLRSAPANDLPYPLFLPTYATTAHYHKKLPSDLQKQDAAAVRKEVERWALNEYMSALAKGQALSGEERAAVEKQLARYTGLPAEVVVRVNLRIEPEVFRDQLLQDGGRRVLGRYDSRIAGYDPDPLSPDADYDPSYPAYHATYAGSFNDYVRRVLKFESDLPYEVLSGRVRPWDFGPSGSGWLTVSNRLRNAMMKSPHMRVMVASGHYDLATPYFGADYTVSHLQLSDDLRKNLSQTYYEGGHMMYHNRADLKKLGEDVAAFIRQASPKPRGGGALAGE